jgi:hypothetical protein
VIADLLTIACTNQQLIRVLAEDLQHRVTSTVLEFPPE